MRLTLCLCVMLAGSCVDSWRVGGFGRGRGSSRGSSSKPKIPAPPPRRPTSVSNTFLDSERGASTGVTHNRPNPFQTPSAPKPPPAGSIGFERFGNTNNQGNHKLGFDKVNSEVQNKPGGSHVPSAPPYPGAPQHSGGSPPVGPPPAYNPGTHTGGGYFGAGDHPPAYPGRPVNAPPSYSSGNTNYGQSYPSQPGFGSNYPGQHNQYQGQSYPGQPNYGGNFGSSFPQQNQFGNVGYGSTYPSFGGSYPGFSGNSYGGSSFGNSYQGNAYGGSPFGGGAGYNSNPHYSPNNFGYSSNPGYFGSQGYSGYPGQYEKKSRFGGLPIPIPIPIPIPFGGGGFGGFGGGNSYNQRLLDTFIRDKNQQPPSGNSTTAVFVLNNSTVTPCTTDHFVYDLLKVSVVSCTAEFCTAVKVYTTTNLSSVVTVHSAGLTMCLEKNATTSSHGDKVTPTVSEIYNETLTVCRDNTTKSTNVTEKSETTTTASPTEVTTMTDTTTTQETTTMDTTTVVATTLPATDQDSTTANSSKVCEAVECYWAELCMPTIEVVDRCNSSDCPFTRTGFKPCVTIKMCRSPSNPISSFASINTTISKIDEYNRHNSVYDVSNLTLISYHRPVITFNCSQNVSSPGCPPPVASPQTCVSSNSTLPTTDGTSSSSVANTTLCTPAVTSNQPVPTDTTGVATSTTTTEIPRPPSR